MVLDRGSSIFVGTFQDLQLMEKADPLFPKISLSAQEKEVDSDDKNGDGDKGDGVHSGETSAEGDISEVKGLMTGM